MTQWITRATEVVRGCEQLALVLFGLVMLLITMWEIFKHKLGKGK